MTYSIFNRDHPGTAEDRVIGAFADAILKLDNCRPALMQAKPRPAKPIRIIAQVESSGTAEAQKPFTREDWVRFVKEPLIVRVMSGGGQGLAVSRLRA